MNEAPSIQTLPGSRIQCREADGQLVLHLPPRPRRLLKNSPAVPRPEDTKIRIEEDYFETRIYFPNGIQTRSFSGIGRAILGLGASAYFVFAIIELLNERHAEWVASTVVCGLFTLFSLMLLLSGLTRLLGRRRLTINPERITLCASLFGIGSRQTLQTTDVISCGSGIVPGRRKRAIAPAKGCVIRTSERDLNFGQWLPSGKDAEWLSAEIARRIDAARLPP